MFVIMTNLHIGRLSYCQTKGFDLGTVVARNREVKTLSGHISISRRASLIPNKKTILEGVKVISKDFCDK